MLSFKRLNVTVTFKRLELKVCLNVQQIKLKEKLSNCCSNK